MCKIPEGNIMSTTVLRGSIGSLTEYRMVENWYTYDDHLTMIGEKVYRILKNV